MSNNFLNKATAKYFFTHYVSVKNWRKKVSGKSSNGKKCHFTYSDMVEINNALPKLFYDVKCDLFK